MCFCLGKHSGTRLKDVKEIARCEQVLVVTRLFSITVYDFGTKKSVPCKQVLVLNELVTSWTYCNGTRTSISLSLDSNKTLHKTFQKHNLSQVFK